jgi:hypothetical protein
LNGQYFVSATSSGGGSPSVIAKVETVPCDGVSVSSGASCLSLTLTVDGASVNLVVQLPAGVISSLATGAAVNLRFVPSGSGRRLSATGCDSTSYDTNTGVVTGVACGAGQYVLVTSDPGLTLSKNWINVSVLCFLGVVLLFKSVHEWGGVCVFVAPRALSGQLGQTSNDRRGLQVLFLMYCS